MKARLDPRKAAPEAMEAMVQPPFLRAKLRPGLQAAGVGEAACIPYQWLRLVHGHALQGAARCGRGRAAPASAQRLARMPLLQ
jgi:hypothetical protein